jgi:corrinoid protein of di/trimethylamine methyltransferase
MVDVALRKTIHDRIIDGDSDAIGEDVDQALAAGESPLALIEEVLNPALKEVGEEFDRGDIYLPELIMAAEAMQVAVAILQPHLADSQQQAKSAGRVVMATVQGDVHDIGKNIVCAVLRANGFQVLDLGRDVTAAVVVAKAREFKADIIGLSTLLSTTMPYCRDTVRLLEELGIRDQFKVFIGGGPVTPQYAENMGAIYGGAHAAAGVQLMLREMGRA